MTVDDAIALIDQLLQPEGLNDLQESVFRLCWQGEDYQQIASHLGYDPGYIRTVGSRIWKELSDLLGKKVTKSNLHTVFRQYTHQLPKELTPEFPGLPLKYQSHFYIQRPPIEQRCSQEMIQPGALIRIQAPKQMGKTSLVYRLLGKGRNLGYQTLRISCQEATVESFTDLNSFLRWLCQNIARKLKLSPNLDQYWDDDPSFAKSNCTQYFEEYLLPSINVPFVLALDDVERIFVYPHIAQDFLPLLRVWHEEANEAAIWQNLRLIVIHSTEVYVPLDIHQSPFNVGLPISLEDWTLQQVQELALKYSLLGVPENVGQKALYLLTQMVGGHPYLIQLALYRLWEHSQENSLTYLEKLLHSASTDSGIYGSHLRRLLKILESSQELCEAMQKVVASEQPVKISPLIAYQLQSMGLIKIVGNLVTTRYPLYQNYFQSRLDFTNSIKNYDD